MFILLVILSFFVTTLFGYLLHWMLHQEWMGRFFKSHMVHHLEIYPPEKFFADKYQDAGKDSTVWFFLVAGLPLLILPIVLFFLGKIGIISMVILVAEASLIGLANNYLHDAFHISNHWLGFFGWFKRLTRLHLNHHIKMGTNFGIFSFLWDRVFKTFND